MAVFVSRNDENKMCQYLCRIKLPSRWLYFVVFIKVTNCNGTVHFWHQNDCWELISMYQHSQCYLFSREGGGPRVVVSTAAFHARAQGSVPCLGGLKETKMFLPHPRVKLSIVWSLRDREIACSTSDRQISSPVSGGQCHLIHSTILRRFSWPSLAYVCTKVA